MIDHILVNRRWLGSVLNSRVYPSADVGSDHQLLACRICLKLKAAKSHTTAHRFDARRLHEHSVVEQYKICISERLAALSSDLGTGCEKNVNEMWTRISDAFNSTSQEVLGTVRNGGGKRWLSPETLQLAAERKDLKPRKLDNAETTKHYNFLCREITRKAKADKEVYLQAICREVKTAHKQKS